MKKRKNGNIAGVCIRPLLLAATLFIAFELLLGVDKERNNVLYILGNANAISTNTEYLTVCSGQSASDACADAPEDAEGGITGHRDISGWAVIFNIAAFSGLSGAAVWFVVRIVRR